VIVTVSAGVTVAAMAAATVGATTNRALRRPL
jgi:hypothetical protein